LQPDSRIELSQLDQIGLLKVTLLGRWLCGEGFFYQLRYWTQGLYSELISAGLRFDLTALAHGMIDLDLGRAAVCIAGEICLLTCTRSVLRELKNVLRDLIERKEISALEKSAKLPILLENYQDVIVRPVLTDQTKPAIGRGRGF